MGPKRLTIEREVSLPRLVSASSNACVVPAYDEDRKYRSKTAAMDVADESEH